MTRVTKGNNGITQKYSSKHKGVDIGHHNNSDDTILAHSKGVVVKVVTNHPQNDKTGSSYGNHIIIDHGSGYWTLYAHLSKDIYVSKSQIVEQGQYIAMMGNSGRSTAKHLHFEVRKGKNDTSHRIDPTKYIKFDLPIKTNKKYKLLFDKWLRKQPKVAVNKIKKIKKDTIIESIDNKLYTDSKGNKWVYTKVSGNTGYICVIDSTGTQAKEV